MRVSAEGSCCARQEINAALPAGPWVRRRVGTLPHSGHGGRDLCIGRKAPYFLLRADNPVVDADFKGAPARAPQCHLRIRSKLADKVRRRTGARFIISLAAVFDFDAHA
jgi:hypothetical protein